MDRFCTDFTERGCFSPFFFLFFMIYADFVGDLSIWIFVRLYETTISGKIHENKQ